MTKQQFREIVGRTGSSLTAAAKDLGLAQSTVSRWNDEVPGYAEWYAVARSLMTVDQLIEIDRRFRSSKPR